ncbi:MAG TPA: hypothetical protein VHO26_06245 [Propionibacteriaceae bacterium]|nr:hypothetical protein [Propionibacteriaceae bacterium]
MNDDTPTEAVIESVTIRRILTDEGMVTEVEATPGLTDHDAGGLLFCAMQILLHGHHRAI